MCGINGLISYTKKLSEEDISPMCDAIKHRGPDFTGLFTDENIAIAHNRLSIIDLSSNANQPYTSISNRYIISFNGEIYNYKKLSREYGLTPKTNSDTEVIIELFAKMGIAMVDKLHGMFAMSIYDKQEKELYLIRDRMGIKPLYYYSDQELFGFSSEIKALKKAAGLSRKLTVDYNSVYNFLHLGFVPDPYSIYNEIRKVPAGSYMMIKGNSINTHYYWKVEDKISEKVVSNFTVAKNTLKTLLEESIEKHLTSDVPIGVFLSGGIDSSLMATIFQKRSATKINTYSVGYSEKGFDESGYARQISKILNTNHAEIIVSAEDAVDSLENLISNFDEPFADSSMLPTYLISKLARKDVKTVLSGEGGDELFMGYGTYDWPDRLKFPLPFNRVIGRALYLTPNDRFQKSSVMFKDYPDHKVHSHIYSQEQKYFSEKELKKILLRLPQEASIPDLSKITGRLKRNLSLKEKQALFDILFTLNGDLLSKTDRTSMYTSLEVRVPFLDHTLVEFALNLSEDLKVKKGIKKYLLKEVLYDYIHKSFFDRPKWGFSIPLEKWLRNELNYLLTKYLSKLAIESVGILNYQMVKNLTERFQKKESYLYNRIWAMIVIQKWFMEHKNN